MRGERHEHIATHHERLLVGQRKLLASHERCVARLHASGSHQGIHHHIDLGKVAQLNDSLRTCVERGTDLSEPCAPSISYLSVRKHHMLDRKLPCLLEEQLCLRVRAERYDLHEFGMAACYIEGLRADRTGGAEHANALRTRGDVCLLVSHEDLQKQEPY